MWGGGGGGCPLSADSTGGGGGGGEEVGADVSFQPIQSMRCPRFRQIQPVDDGCCALSASGVCACSKQGGGGGGGGGGVAPPGDTHEGLHVHSAPKATDVQCTHKPAVI